MKLFLLIVATLLAVTHARRGEGRYRNVCKIVYSNQTEELVKECTDSKLCLPPKEVKTYFCKSEKVYRPCKIEVSGEVVRENECTDGSECVERIRPAKFHEKWRCQCDPKDDECLAEKKFRKYSRKSRKHGFGHLHGRGSKSKNNNICKIEYKGNTEVLNSCDANKICKPESQYKMYVCQSSITDNTGTSQKWPKICKVEIDGRIVKQKPCYDNSECVEKEYTVKKIVWRCQCNTDDCIDESMKNRKSLRHEWRRAYKGYRRESKINEHRKFSRDH